MNIGRMRGGRRQIVQLDDTNNETTFLARKENKMRVGSASKKHKPAGLSALGEYYDSTDSEENENGGGMENGIEPSTSSSVHEPRLDGEVANFLAEVQSISASNSPKDMTTRESSLTPPPSSSSSTSKSDKPSNLYRSMFVKGGTEWNKKSGNSEEVSSTEIDELPEEPTTLWQICVDENTQYQYYWNTVTNEVTWTIPADYTQYLLKYKLYEEQLAKIPQERQDYLNKKKLGLIQSPIPAKPKNQPKPPTESYNMASSSQSCDQTTTETQSERTSTVETTAEMTDPEKQFYSEIEELEKMDSVNGKENGGEITPADGDSSIKVDVEVDDIDNALEKALEKKKEELKNLESEATATVETNSSTKKRSRRQNSPDSSIYMSSSKSKKSRNGATDWKEAESDDKLEKTCSETAETVRKVLVNYEHDESDGDVDNGMLKRLQGEGEEQDELDIEERREILEGKLEFLCVTRKGLNKLQIMLIELQTRYTDYLKGALNEQYFLQKLSTLGKYLEVYEKQAMPEGWTCRWDRTFRLYRYVNDLTGETQWEHPDASVQVIGETMSHRRRHSSGSSKTRSSKSHSSKRSKEKRREERKSSKSSKSRRADRSLSPEPTRKSSKSRRKEKTNIESIVENISLGGLLSKNRDVKSDNISISDDATEEVSITAPPSISVEEHVESPPPPSYSMDTCEEDSVEEKIPDPEPMTASPEQQDITSEALLPGHFTSEVSTSSTCPSSSSHALPSTTSAVSSSTYHGNGATPVAMDTELDGEPMVSSSEIKIEEHVPKEMKKKKKEKVMANTNFALKKKNVSSLVNKWKKVKIEVEKEEKIDEERQLAIRQKLEEWKKDH